MESTPRSRAAAAATAAAVPFLYELLAAPDVQDKSGIVSLLGCIATGEGILQSALRNDGEEMWQALKDNPNLKFVFNGHVLNDGTGYLASIGDNGEIRRKRSLSVAGSSEKSFEAGGITYSHIMDPRTGKPVQGMLSVAVLTKTGTEGDALDDALFVLGPSKSAEYLKHFPDAEALFFLPDADRGWKMVRGGEVAQ